MTPEKCKLGCKENGRPTWHPGKWACPKREEYDPERLRRYEEEKRRVDELRQQLRRSPSPGASPSSPPSSSTSEDGPEPARAPGVKVAEEVTFGGPSHGEADTVSRRDVPTAPDTDWLLTPEHCRSLFRVGFSIVGRVVHFIDRLLEVPKAHWAPDELFSLTPGDEANAGMGFGQRLATKFVKALGARTLQEGQQTADSISLGNIVAGLAIGVAEHGIVVWKESEVLKRHRAERAKGLPPRRNFWNRRRRAPRPGPEPQEGEFTVTPEPPPEPDDSLTSPS